jgi:D-tyrosyl-tRNA(Tyr) deacylase
LPQPATHHLKLPFIRLPDTAKGNPPSFTRAATPERAEPLVERFREVLSAPGVPTATGRFGARMEVWLVNDGPVTIVVDVDPERTRRSP